jgi:hypothetical protein
MNDQNVEPAEHVYDAAAVEGYNWSQLRFL